jgi:hypothetical protein
MKKILFSIILLFSVLNLLAQSSNIHEFGNVSIDDLKMKVYDKDSSATALCMLSSGYVYIDSDWPLGKSSITYHYRFKLFKNASFYLASIKIPIDPSQGISEMKAQTIWLNDNGEIKRQNIDQKDFVENKLINNARLLEFNFPALKDGCIIEYTYKIASWRKYLVPTWYFQSEVPTMYSQLSLEMKQIVNLSSVIKGAHITEDNSTVTQSLEKRAILYIEGRQY